MKKIIALILCTVLIISVASDVVSAGGTDPKSGIGITGYSVAGVLNVADVYAITLNMKWNGPSGSNPEVKIDKLTIEALGDNFKPAIASGSRYIIANEALEAAPSTIARLNSSAIASQTFHFLRTGELSNELEIKLNAIYDNGEIASPATILVIKSEPDPLPPPLPPIEPDPIPVDTTKYRPSLGVAAGTALPLLDQATAELLIPIKNTAIYAANKITVSMEPADKNKPLFMANSITIAASINTLSRDQVKDAKFPVKLAPGAINGVHPITLSYTFRNNHGDLFTDQETAYIQVNNQNAAPRLAAICSQWLTPGKETQAEFILTNSGSTAARNIKVTLEGLDPAAVSIINDIDVKYVDLIEGGSKAAVRYNLLPALSLAGSSTRLQLKIDYVDTNGEAYSDTNSVFLPLNSTQEDDKGVPRLIINKYSFTPQDIRAGGQFVLYLDLQNTSRNKAISNLKVTIMSEEGIFLPIDASNTLFIETIAPSQVVSASLALTTKADAENKPYPLRITFDYEDSQSVEHNAQEMISIPVQQNSRLVVGDIMLYGDPMLHDMVPINVEFYNLGKTILYNLMVKAEGPFQFEGGSYFVGNFNPGASDSFNFAVVPTEPGEQLGAIIFQFEDSVGAALEVRRELKLNVIEPYYPEDPDHELPPPPQSTNKKLYVGIGAATLIIPAVGFYLWRRRRQKQTLKVQQADDFTAATAASVPKIEYVGFEDTSKPDEPDTKS